ncbi:acyl transferase/acyl hydrolase/lysophospholipase [Aspergillus novoparasiticus]|uniref:Acyl transferase/acyl hydrolase/lysophospholipase n=1 Tax=Aspergillus novoparasiticus TaxID=986946 RepID=A0A5N6EI37_9EURO|nr:acyl transferase/acyl hydrolase/lysophospholipase [Aspergillus novoparasiticus]
MPSSAEQAPVKLLSIDGGGVRGLSALVLLEQLMGLINHKRENMNLPPQEPWEIFDMIGGTSTGGLIAVMLGRLRMSIEDCIAAYENLADRAFTEQNFLNLVKGKITLGPRFKTQPLEDAIKTIIGDTWETDLLYESGRPRCQVFVVAHLQNTNKAAILRSYRNYYAAKAQLDEMRIWQACRATSAALTYFEPIEVGYRIYSDGGLLYNNPVQLVHSEASDMFQGRDQLIVSLGTGIPRIEEWKPSLASIAKDLAALATDAENTANVFHKLGGGKAAKEGRYFRFSVLDLGNIGLEESKRLKDIKVLTESYIDDAGVGDKVDSCAQQLAEGVCALHEVPMVPKAFTNKHTGSHDKILEERLRKLNTSPSSTEVSEGKQALSASR